MLEASPGLSLCSSGPYPNKEWAEFSAKPLAGISQMISQHYYGYDPHYTDLSTVEEEYNRCMASVSRMRELIHQSRQWLEPSIRISMDEWNVWYAWYRPSSVTDGIYAALVLHMLMEEAEKKRDSPCVSLSGNQRGNAVCETESRELDSARTSVLLDESLAHG